MSRFYSLSLCVGLIFSVAAGSVLAAPQVFHELEDAAVAQAKLWQSGGRARPLMSSDGKIVFAFGQSMPKLTCSPGRACDVEMEPGEKVKTVILADKVNWAWEGAESVEKGKTIQHLVFQPRDKDLETNVIVTTDRRTYHVRLFSPKVEGDYLNRAGFYYPSDLVSSWAEKMGAEASATAKEESSSVMPAAVSPMKLAFDYRINGDADFTPVRVFNDGERVYMEMPDNLRTGENPVFMLIDEKGNEMVVNYRREIDPSTNRIHYVVDKLFNKGELRMGPNVVKISWKRQEKNWWSSAPKSIN
jgi:type IV secretion system protein VirB9